MKKKLLTILLAATMVMSFGVVAHAADGDQPSVTPEAVEVTKEYTLTGGKVTPAEKLEFEVALVSGVEGGVTELPTVGANKDNKVAITSSETATTNFDINFPTYSKIGVYTYTITEKEGSTLGVTYDTTPIYVVVTVTNKEGSTADATEDAFEYKVAIHKGSATAEKTDEAEFKNEYGQGALTVTKQVTGNLASNTKKFTIKVTFTGESTNDITYSVAGGENHTLTFENGEAEVEIELSSTQSATFNNIPAGVTYEVVEDPKHAEGADHPETTEEGYTVSYDFSDDEKAIAAKETDTVTITNTKEKTVDTGINLDSLPYIIIGAVVVALIAVMVIRRRRNAEY